MNRRKGSKTPIFLDFFRYGHYNKNVFRNHVWLYIVDFTVGLVEGLPTVIFLSFFACCMRTDILNQCFSTILPKREKWTRRIFNDT